jgi:hypothetical protein
MLYLCYTMLYLCYTYAIPLLYLCYAMLYLCYTYAIPMLYHAMPCYTMLCHTIPLLYLCYAMLYLCYAILYLCYTYAIPLLYLCYAMLYLCYTYAIPVLGSLSEVVRSKMLWYMSSTMLYGSESKATGASGGCRLVQVRSLHSSHSSLSCDRSLPLSSPDGLLPCFYM